MPDPNKCGGVSLIGVVQNELMLAGFSGQVKPLADRLG